MTALRVETGDEKGQPTAGRLRRVVKMVLRLIDTSRVSIDAGNGAEAMVAQPIGLFSGDTDDLAVGGSYGRDATFTVLSDDPLPAFVAAAMPRMVVGGR